MRTDHPIETNEASALYAAHLERVIKIREDELAALRKALVVAQMVGAGNLDPVPSFMSPADEGFKRVADAAEAVERRNGRPVVATQTEQAA